MNNNIIIEFVFRMIWGIMQIEEGVIHLDPVPRMMVKFNPGLSEILSTVFLLRACNSSLQNTVKPLLWDTVTIYTKCYSKQCIGK